MAPTPALIAACGALIVLTSCTSPVVTPAPTPSVSASSPAPTAPPTSASASPTSSPTWTADQTAAIAAVDDYRAAVHRIEIDPAGFTEAQMKTVLKRVAGGKVITATVASYMDLKKRGLRYGGDTSVVSTDVSRASAAAYGIEAFVTRCTDQRMLRALDRTGREVSDAELGYNIPDFNLRQYTVVKRSGTKRFLVYGFAPTKGRCAP